jgi:hypothetical protein
MNRRRVAILNRQGEIAYHLPTRARMVAVCAIFDYGVSIYAYCEIEIHFSKLNLKS